jgi:hypothetical protein
MLQDTGYSKEIYMSSEGKLEERWISWAVE